MKNCQGKKNKYKNKIIQKRKEKKTNKINKKNKLFYCFLIFILTEVIGVGIKPQRQDWLVKPLCNASHEN